MGCQQSVQCCGGFEDSEFLEEFKTFQWCIGEGVESSCSSVGENGSLGHEAVEQMNLVVGVDFTKTNKMLETFSCLPPLSNEQIDQQMDYILHSNRTHCLTQPDCPYIYDSPPASPCRGKGGQQGGDTLPPFRYQVGKKLLAEIAACSMAFPDAFIRVMYLDSKLKKLIRVQLCAEKFLNEQSVENSSDSNLSSDDSNFSNDSNSNLGDSNSSNLTSGWDKQISATNFEDSDSTNNLSDLDLNSPIKKAPNLEDKYSNFRQKDLNLVQNIQISQVNSNLNSNSSSDLNLPQFKAPNLEEDSSNFRQKDLNLRYKIQIQNLNSNSDSDLSGYNSGDSNSKISGEDSIGQNSAKNSDDSNFTDDQKFLNEQKSISYDDQNLEIQNNNFKFKLDLEKCKNSFSSQSLNSKNILNNNLSESDSNVDFYNDSNSIEYDGSENYDDIYFTQNNYYYEDYLKSLDDDSYYYDDC